MAALTVQNKKEVCLDVQFSVTEVLRFDINNYFVYVGYIGFFSW